MPALDDRCEIAHDLGGMASEDIKLGSEEIVLVAVGDGIVQIESCSVGRSRAVTGGDRRRRSAHSRHPNHW